MTEAQSAEKLEAALDFIGRIAEAGGSTASGLLSNPWTGVPAILITLSTLDPSGKVSAAFLQHLGDWIKQLATWIFNVISKTEGLPPENPTGLYCVRLISQANVESHKCYDTAAERDSALATLRSEDIFHLFGTIEPYDQTVGVTLFCVRYLGFLNTP